MLLYSVGKAPVDLTAEHEDYFSGSGAEEDSVKTHILRLNKYLGEDFHLTANRLVQKRVKVTYYTSRFELERDVNWALKFMRSDRYLIRTYPEEYHILTHFSCVIPKSIVAPFEDKTRFCWY
jgi:hypothetical protein